MNTPPLDDMLLFSPASKFFRRLRMLLKKQEIKKCVRIQRTKYVRGVSVFAHLEQEKE